MLYKALQCCLEESKALGKFSQRDLEGRELLKNISFQSNSSPALSLEIIKTPLPLLESEETLAIFSLPVLIPSLSA